MNFEFPEDKEYFEAILKEIGGIKENEDLFDFRSPEEKRSEFGKIRNSIFEALVREKGEICELRWDENCTGVAENIDHLIPLKTNKLNKELRREKGKKGKKVPAQSFGSNNPRNFVLACRKCNATKKHQIPDSRKLWELLS